MSSYFPDCTLSAESSSKAINYVNKCSVSVDKSTTSLNDSLTFPVVRGILWDRSYLSGGLLIKPCDIVPNLAISGASLKDIYTYVKSKNSSRSNIAKISCERYNKRTSVFNLDCSSLGDQNSSNSMNRFDLSVPISCNFNLSEDCPHFGAESTRLLIENLRKSLAQSSTFSLRSCMRIRASVNTMTLQCDECSVRFECIIPSNPLQFKILKPLPVFVTPFFKNLICVPANNAQSDQTDSEFGYLSLNQTRKVLLLPENDPAVRSMGLVGVWVRLSHSSTSNSAEGLTAAELLKNPMVWAACIRFSFNEYAVRDRVLVSSGTFLVACLLGTSVYFFECTILSDDVQEISELERISKNISPNFQLFECGFRLLLPDHCPGELNDISQIFLPAFSLPDILAFKKACTYEDDLFFELEPQSISFGTELAGKNGTDSSFALNPCNSFTWANLPPLNYDAEHCTPMPRPRLSVSAMKPVSLEENQECEVMSSPIKPIRVVSAPTKDGLVLSQQLRIAQLESEVACLKEMLQKIMKGQHTVEPVVVVKDAIPNPEVLGTEAPASPVISSEEVSTFRENETMERSEEESVDQFSFDYDSLKLQAANIPDSINLSRILKHTKIAIAEPSSLCLPSLQSVQVMSRGSELELRNTSIDYVDLLGEDLAELEDTFDTFNVSANNIAISNNSGNSLYESESILALEKRYLSYVK